LSSNIQQPALLPTHPHHIHLLISFTTSEEESYGAAPDMNLGGINFSELGR
jgi:hypothetical protein